MARIKWDSIGERVYETGVDHGVLYLQNEEGEFDNGVAWNGLVSVNESPTGAEANPQYADNIKYLNLYSAEEFGATIEAFTYPDEFAICDGTAEIADGVRLAQQSRRQFGFSYRTLIGNDLSGTDHGYKLHLVYNAMASPSEKAYNTINDSPEAITFSWEVTTTPIAVGEIDGVQYRPTALVTIDSTSADTDSLALLEALLYGDDDAEAAVPTLPTPQEVYALFSA